MNDHSMSTEADALSVVETRVEGPILIVTINRPEARNAINHAVAQGLEQAMSELDQRPTLRVGILTGAGAHFCAGMDLKAFANGDRPWMPESGFGGLVERRPHKPLLAAIEGGALAGGLELALACDIIVASREAFFGLPEVSRGLVAAAGGLLRLQHRVPRGLAMELALTGRRMNATEAANAGLVTRLVDSRTALPAALQLAEEIARNAPLALMATKTLLWDARTWREDEMFRLQEPLVSRILDSDDAREGAFAFAEKRSPEWQGR